MTSERLLGMGKHDAACCSRSTLIEEVYGLLILSLFGCGIVIATIVLVMAVPLALVAAISPSSSIVPWLWDLLRVVALFLSGAMTMLMAPRWLQPAPGVPVAVVRVVVVATLSLLPFPVIGLWLNPEYGLEPYSQLSMVWLSWVAGGLTVALLRGLGRRKPTEHSAGQQTGNL